MRKLSYTPFVVFVLAIVGVGTYAYWYTTLRTTSDATSSPSAPKVAITNRDAAAFGAFSANPTTLQSTRAEDATATNSGGGTTKATLDASSPSSLIAPIPATYEYIYTGEALTILSLPVLKRTNALPTETLQSILQSVNLGVINLEKFSNLKVQNLALAEDKDEGYVVNIDLREGTVNLYQNWERWALPLRAAVDSVNSAATSSLPGDEQLIAIADAFLAQYGISRAAYSAPVVPKTYFGYGETRLSAGISYLQNVQVIYPLVVNGKTVVSENGYPTGLIVDVDVALLRVTGVSNLTSLAYEASAYPLVSDTAKVLAVVQRGGLYNAVNAEATGIPKIRIEVGTPTVGYYSSRYQIDQTSTEYLIPALVFPITNAPTGAQLYRTAIVVPLVQDVLEPQVSVITGSGGSTGSSAGTAVDTATPTTR